MKFIFSQSGDPNLENFRGGGTCTAFSYLAPLPRYHGLKSNMQMLDFNLKYLSNGARYKKVIYMF